MNINFIKWYSEKLLLHVIFLTVFIIEFILINPVIDQCEAYFGGDTQSAPEWLKYQDKYYEDMLYFIALSLILFYTILGLITLIQFIRFLLNRNSTLFISWYFIITSILNVLVLLLANYLWNTAGNCDLILGPADTSLGLLLITNSIYIIGFIFISKVKQPFKDQEK